MIAIDTGPAQSAYRLEGAALMARLLGGVGRWPWVVG